MAVGGGMVFSIFFLAIFLRQAVLSLSREGERKVRATQGIVLLNGKMFVRA